MIPVKDRIGERKKNNIGLWAEYIELVEEGCGAKIKIRFDIDGAERIVKYCHFMHGEFSHPFNNAFSHVGERKKMNCGDILEITRPISRDSNGRVLYEGRFDTRFSISRPFKYNEFVRGKIGFPGGNAMLHIGEKKKMNGGSYFTLDKVDGSYKSAKTFSGHFDDGIVVSNVLYSHFTRGAVVHPLDRIENKIGLRVMNTAGLYATFIEDEGCDSGRHRIAVMFDDGEVLHGVEFSHFTAGEFAHPKYNPNESSGERKTREILERLNIEYIREFSPKWLNKRRMDFCIESLKLIIEFHGEQHFVETNRGRTLKEEQKNDDFKFEACIKHGYDVWIFAYDGPHIDNYRHKVHTLEELPKMLLERLKEVNDNDSDN